MNNTSTSTAQVMFRNHLEMVRNNYQAYRKSYLKIRTKESGIRPFSPNLPQLIFEEKLREQARENKPIRAIVLKGRQEGITTDTGGIIFHDTVSRPDRKSVVVSHEPDSTRAIFDIYKTYYDCLPDVIRPMKRYDNTTTLTFDNPKEELRNSNPGLKSSISVFTANKKGGGRSQTIHNLHCSEVAFWECDERELMKGLLQAVPNHIKTMVIIESTANGTDNYFYDTYMKAKKRQSDFVAIFIPWWVHEEYQSRYSKNLELEELDETEQNLYNLMRAWSFGKYKIDHKQALTKLAWRKWCIRNNCGGSVKTFMQEYPSSDMEAFQKKEGRVYWAFDRDKHVIPHFEPDIDMNLFIGGYDFGAEHPTAYGLFAIDKHGIIFKFREFKQVGTTFEEQATEFKRMETHRVLSKRFPITARYRGHDSGAKQAERELKRLGIRMKEGIVKRELGITTINGLFLEGKYYISDECVNTIFELENHVYKNKYSSKEEDGVLKLEGEEHKDGDVLKVNDDCVDGDRYGITSFMHLKHKEKLTPIQRYQENIRREVQGLKSSTKINW